MSSNGRNSSSPPAKRSKVSHRSTSRIVYDVNGELAFADVLEGLGPGGEPEGDLGREPDREPGREAGGSVGLAGAEVNEGDGVEIREGGEAEKEEEEKKKAGGSWLRCGVGGCAFKCKYRSDLKVHKAHVHGIDVKWFKCDQCDHKSKQNGDLKQHKAHIHGIDVKWFKCDKCEYKCKQNGDLKRHKAFKH